MTTYSDSNQARVDLPQQSSTILTPDRLFADSFAFWKSAVLLSAHDVGLFAALTSEALDPAGLALRLSSRQDTLEDLLEALAALGLVEQHGGRYHNAPEARQFLDPDQPAYIGPWLAMAADGMRAMANLGERLRLENAEHPAPATLAERMWADIAELLTVEKF